MSDDDDKYMERVWEWARQQVEKAAAANVTEPNMTSKREWQPSDSSASRCASGDTVSSIKKSDKQPAAEQGPLASLQSKGLTSSKTSRVFDTKVSQLPLNSKSRPCSASPNISESTLQNRSLNPVNKATHVPADFQSARNVKVGYPPSERPTFPNYRERALPKIGSSDLQSAGFVKVGNRTRERHSCSNQGKGVFPDNVHSGSQSDGLAKMGYPRRERSSLCKGQETFFNNDRTNNKLNDRTWNRNDKFKFGEKLQRNGELKPCSDTNRGPRARGEIHLSLPAKKDLFGFTVQKEKYNLPDFKIKYENAKFFVIKSYSEKDIHKSVKYDVWASTAYGNRKLDAAFQDASTISSMTGKTCPIFLFFSANGSGQFVGLAEMTGPVDFKKNMDFWHQDKWNGFFPVDWHIIKDIPNHQLRHIILENNENKPVTFTRDTQEVELKQGLEMLSIFKNYPAKTMLLDDYDFYEDQEKSLPDKTSAAASPQTMIYGDELLVQPHPQQPEAGVRKTDASVRAKKPSYQNTSLVTLKKLSLNSHPAETGA